MAILDQETDSLSGLEERIHKAVQLVQRLRQERDAAVKDAAEAHAHSDKLSQELDSLRAERKNVRVRIEKLLGHIDQLGAS
ncbi:MAG: cell division protein ZapB [Acidobacteriota bacterium]|nr:cell division protein ZapB [Acidobacteriota bacterium]